MDITIPFCIHNLMYARYHHSILDLCILVIWFRFRNISEDELKCA
jgi:hypothetical protein